MNLMLTKGRSDRDTNPQLPGQKQHAKQLRRLVPSVLREGTKPNGQMRRVFTPNMPYGPKQLSDNCLLARTGAIWGKRESFMHNRSTTAYGSPAAVGRTRAEDNPPPPG